MSSREEMTLPATRPRSRKSLGHVPSSQTMDQENMTADMGSLATGKRAPIEKPSRKSRSKSIGPGGLDALKDTNGNRRKSLAAIPHPPPKSILKPTMPPLREIPAHISTRKGSPKKTTPPLADKTGNLIDFDIDPAPTITGTENLLNPFDVGGNAAVNETRVTLRTEEEQQAAAREREEKERADMEKEINARRDARRKSLANRRVSFAPEATLHTWDVVVEYQDSTTSSNSTNSTRRASSITQGSVVSQNPQAASSDPSEPPSTPPDQVEEETVTASPAHQRGLHQKKRRRSSGIPPMNFNNPDDDAGFSSSPFSGDSVGDADEVGDEKDSNSDSDDDDGTMMSLDGGDTTEVSMASVSDASTGSSTRLDAALQRAIEQAETQDLDFDEDRAGDDSDVMATFTPSIKKPTIGDPESQHDQENINPFAAQFKRGLPMDEEDASDDGMTMDITRAVGGIIPSRAPAAQEDEDEMSMDVTKAFGGVISNGITKSVDARRKSMTSNRRQSTRRRSSAEEFSFGDDSMEFTMAIGSIQLSQEPIVTQEEEDVTMEFTSVVGGVLSQAKPATKNTRRASMQQSTRNKRRESIREDADDETMDMTMAMGSIMPLHPKLAAPIEEEIEVTMGMDMTTALGAILQPQREPENRFEAKKVMELETDLGSSPFRTVPESPAKTIESAHTVASETGSPSMVGFRGKGFRRSAEARQSTTPKSRLSETPVKKPTTPSKQLTPKPPRPTTPGKTTPSKNVVMRTASPKKLFQAEIKAASTPPSALRKKAVTPNKLFQKNTSTGAATPNFILTPQPRRRSGVGLDRIGLGSPRVAALLDRRGSIGQQASPFVPSAKENSHAFVRFEDPRLMEEELEKEREIEGDRENGRSILEREADQGEDEKDATLNLKDMIQNMTPKRKPLRGRKSLHVGAAKGILGKRPAELDEDEEDDEDNAGVKRLKNFQGSPVKNVRLPAPPSKAETTTGRLTRAARKSLDETTASLTTPSITSPTNQKVTTPRGQGRFKDVEVNNNIENIEPPSERIPQDDPVVDEESFNEERIQLQDFLNMTSIRFMELTTTKRRHTIAPRGANSEETEKEIALEDCVAAGAATVPMLELYQHACKELKAYISEGRKTVREIEVETYEENPPLFREYISATPDMKTLMDNQLKNVKTHARLLSKGMWYDWRSTLLATLKDGLVRTAEGMIQDEEVLDQQQELLDTVLPQLIEESDRLSFQKQDLQAAADEIANCDQEELSEARQQLIVLDSDVEAKKQILADLQKQLERKEAEIKSGNEKKQLWLGEIHEAEKIREECRGWSSSEISVLKGKVEALEKEHGWTITGVSGTITSMTYLKEIELVFDPSSFLRSQPNGAAEEAESTRIDLWYIGAVREHNPDPLTADKEFFLQCTRDHIRELPQAQTRIKDLLHAVSSSWHKAKSVADDIRRLKHCGEMEIAKTSDNSIKVTSKLVIKPVETKVEISFNLECHSGENGIVVQIEPEAKVIYGERFKEGSMKDFLVNRCGSAVEASAENEKMAWGEAVAELEKKLIARGKK